MRIASSYVLVLLLATAGTLGAEPVHKNIDAVAIRAQQAQIRSDIAAGTGRYKGMSEAKRRQVMEAQEVVDRLLAGKSAVTDLPEVDRIAVFNALEAISAAINDEGDDRMICMRNKPVGSNRPRTVCKTVAQLKADERSVQADIGRGTLECSEATMGPGGCKR